MEEPLAQGAVVDSLRFAEDLGAATIRVAAREVVPAIAQIACDVNAATLVVGDHDRGWLRGRLRRQLAMKLPLLLGDVDLPDVRLDQTHAPGGDRRPTAP